jgi:Rrf2 family protein
MKLSMAAELAVRGILELVERHGQPAPLTLEDICQKRDLPRQYLTKIFGQLGRANLIAAVRGKNGGYRLARPPQQITLLEVIEAVEGPLAVNLCQHTPSRCEQAECRARDVWCNVQQHLRAALSAKTLDQLIQPPPAAPTAQPPATAAAPSADQPPAAGAGK